MRSAFCRAVKALLNMQVETLCPKTHQSTGLLACCKRYGLFSFASRFRGFLTGGSLPVAIVRKLVSQRTVLLICLQPPPRFVAFTNENSIWVLSIRAHLITRKKTRNSSSMFTILHNNVIQPMPDMQNGFVDYRVQSSSERHPLQQLLHARCGRQVATGNKCRASPKHIFGKL